MRRTYGTWAWGGGFTGLALAGCAAVLGIEDTHVDPPFEAGLRDGATEGGPLIQDSGVDPRDDGGGPRPPGPDGSTPPIVIVPKCDLAKPFSKPAQVPDLSTGNDEFGARYTTVDETTIIFTRKDELFTATRAAIGGVFVNPQKIGELNVNNNISSHLTTADGVRAYFSRQLANQEQIFETSRPAGAVRWTDPLPVAVLGTSAANPWLVADGKALYYDADVAGQQRGLFRAEVKDNKVVGPGTAVPGGLDTAATEINPVVTADELTMYFSRGNVLSLLIQRVTRQRKEDPWGAPAPVAELNHQGIAEDRVTWISPDGCRVLLSSTRSGGGDILSAEKPK